MDKEMLKRYTRNRGEIRYLTEKLDHLGDDGEMINHSVIMDYKTGFPRPQAVIGYDLELEKHRRKRLEDLRAKLAAENDQIEEFVFSIMDSQTRRIFQLYFLDAKTQDDVGRKLHMDRSQVSKKIDAYLQSAHNAQKNTL